MTLRCWFGHQWSATLTAPFTDTDGRWKVRCTECEWRSPGLVVPSTRPVDLPRATRHVRVRSIEEWKDRYDRRQTA